MSAVTEAGEFQKIFNHASVKRYNSYSRHIFKQLYECHTTALGMHHYRCDDPTVTTCTSNIIAVATGTAPTVAA